MFGTSGVRGPVGEDVTAALALDVGRALATDGQVRPLTDRRPKALVPVGDRPPRYRTWGSSSSSSRTSTLQIVYHVMNGEEVSAR